MSDTRAAKAAKEINEFASALKDPDGDVSRHIVPLYASRVIEEAFAGEVVPNVRIFGRVD